jgi:exodeoxyribonuclease VII large subunit
MALETSADSPAPLRQISQLLDGYVARLGAVWVEAEIAQLTRRPGICFLTLRDLRAKISIDATCRASVLDASPVPITEGSRVVVHAKPTFYAPRGGLALDLREIRPQGEGELLAQLERRKQLLAAEGLFDPRLKRTLPLLPRGR